jgi:hypothetical protein
MSLAEHLLLSPQEVALPWLRQLNLAEHLLLLPHGVPLPWLGQVSLAEHLLLFLLLKLLYSGSDR